MSRSLDEARAVLGVAADTSPGAVAQAYRRLARMTHPDVSPAPDAAQRFAAVCAAYQLLRDSPARRPAVARPVAVSEPDPTDADAGPSRIGDEPVVRRGISNLAMSPLRPDYFVRPVAPIVAGPVTVRPSRSDPTTRRASSRVGR